MLELGSAFSCLAISTDQDPSEPQERDEERTQPELQLPVTSDQAHSYRDGLQPARKRLRDTSSSSGERPGEDGSSHVGGKNRNNKKEERKREREVAKGCAEEVAESERKISRRGS
ncbi:hypothetical protein GBF38_000637 [Nibea albiflora]|nr:hypothetical protein GBF38_000637 [Nibea albiflora]